MRPFTPFESPILPVRQANIDTDQITPARFLKASRAKGGYGEILFWDWRFHPSGQERPDCVFNRPEYRGAEILVAGDNFGCGSSRETAPWALVEYGFRCVISTSFADIFRTNALKNGLLPLVVDEGTLEGLLGAAERSPGCSVRVDLGRSTLGLADGREVGFAVDSFYRQCLLEGVDQLGFLLGRTPDIEAWEAANPSPVTTS